MLLDTTVRKLQVVLGGAVATNQLQFRFDVEELDQATGEWSDAVTHIGTTNGATPVDAVAVPSSADERLRIKWGRIFQADTAAVVLTVRTDNDGTPSIEFRATLQPGDQVCYSAGMGWVVVDSQGNRRHTWPANLAYSQLPTGSGTWDVGSGNALTLARGLILSSTLLRGHTALLAMGGATPDQQGHGTGDAGSRVGLGRWSADASGPRWVTGKSRGGIGSYTIVQVSDALGAWDALGADGVDLATIAGRLQFQVYPGATPAANRVGGQLALFLAAGAADDDLSTTPQWLVSPLGLRLRRAGNLPNIQSIMTGNVALTDATASTVFSFKVPNPGNPAFTSTATVRGHLHIHTRNSGSWMMQAVEVCFTVARGRDTDTQFGAITLGTTLVSQENGTSATQVTALTAGALSLARSGASTAEQTISLQVNIDVDTGVTTFNALFDGWLCGGATSAGEAPYIDSI